MFGVELGTIDWIMLEVSFFSLGVCWHRRRLVLFDGSLVG